MAFFKSGRSGYLETLQFPSQSGEPHLKLGDRLDFMLKVVHVHRGVDFVA